MPWKATVTCLSLVAPQGPRKGAMTGLVELLAIAAYILGGGFLFLRMQKGLRDPQRPMWAADMFRADLFTEAGQRLRKQALLFYVFGLIAVLVILTA